MNSSKPDGPSQITVDRSTPQLGSLFQALILEHYKHPRNKGELPEANSAAHLHNPACGDDVLLRLTLTGGHIVAARFQGEGCSISQASVSMMARRVEGRSVVDALALAARFKEMLRDDREAATDAVLGDLRSLAGVSRFPVRIKCALLAFEALEAALEEQGEAAVAS